MLGKHKIIVDTQSQMFELITDFADSEFHDLANHTIVPGAVYVIGRNQFRLNVDYIRRLIESNQIYVVLGDPSEGSASMILLCRVLNAEDLVLSGKVLLLSGGDIDSSYTSLSYEFFLNKIFDYPSNQLAMQRTPEVYEKTDKPYKFLFLNGRYRPHRKYLLEKFRLSGLLDQSLWTNLDSSESNSKWLTLISNNKNLLFCSMPVHCLPAEYEVEEYSHRVESIPSHPFVKPYLFNNTWGDIYLNPMAYIDTYFSVVTETVFNYPYSFRTEKIWKPIAMGHPWVAVANAGYYRDIKNLGFKTFGHLIDESFDQIESSQARIERIEQVVQDLCNQDLVSFLGSARDVCEHNQRHLEEARQIEIKKFPDRFSNFLKTHLNKK